MTNSATKNERLGRYEVRTGALMIVLAAVFIAVYGVPVVWPDLPEPVHRTLNLANLAIWSTFAADLAIRVWLADQRLRYLAGHPIDVASVVLPALRPLRVLRIFTAAQTLISRAGRVAFFHSTRSIGVAAGLLLLIGALAVLDAEQDAPDANIQSFGDALWWGAATVTTVGYGDVYPVTSQGRIVAGALMVVGISLVGTITATVAAWFLAQTRVAVAEASVPNPSDDHTEA